MVLASVLVLTACTAGNGQMENAAGQQTSGSGSAEQSSASDSKKQDNITAQTDSTNNSRQDQTGSEGNNAKDATPSDAAAPAAYAGAAFELASEWLADQEYALASPAPANLEELKKTVDVTDPRSVAAYWVYSVNRLVENYNDGMEMMKYLFADIEPYGRGYTEGGGAGKAGWDSYFDERLKDSNYSWLPRAYFNGTSTRADKFALADTLSIDLYYNDSNTRSINDQTLGSLGRLNIVYWVQSRAAGNQVNITLSRFEGTDRWYVTSGVSSSALFYMQ